VCVCVCVCACVRACVCVCVCETFEDLCNYQITVNATYTGMPRIKTFLSTMDHMYDGGHIRLYYNNISLE
jgi:hypothetical protein